eukprot:scaffold96283_cov21-Tisochrysis_lutea.AAC.3
MPLRPLPPDLMSDSVAPVRGRGGFVDEPDGEGFDNTVIWGTTISVAATERAARQFLEGFVSEDEMGEETQSKYFKLIAQVWVQRAHFDLQCCRPHDRQEGTMHGLCLRPDAPRICQWLRTCDSKDGAM